MSGRNPDMTSACIPCALGASCYRVPSAPVPLCAVPVGHRQLRETTRAPKCTPARPGGPLPVHGARSRRSQYQPSYGKPRRCRLAGRCGHSRPDRTMPPCIRSTGGDATLQGVVGWCVRRPFTATRTGNGLPLVCAAREAHREVARTAASRSRARREGAQPALPHPVPKRLRPAGDAAARGLTRRCIAQPDWVAQAPRADSTITRLRATPPTRHSSAEANAAY